MAALFLYGETGPNKGENKKDGLRDKGGGATHGGGASRSLYDARV